MPNFFINQIVKEELEILKEDFKAFDKLSKKIPLILLIPILPVSVYFTFSPLLYLNSWMPIRMSVIFRILDELILLFLGFLFIILFLMFLVYLIVFIFGKFQNKIILKSLVFLLIIIAYFSFFVMPTRVKLEMSPFDKLAERSVYLVEAIKKFEQDKGKPPVNLLALVPEYLPKIPSTKISAYPYYEYNILEQKKKKQFVAGYDLGSRKGKEAKYQFYNYGKKDHSIAVIHYDEDGEIEHFFLDRLPKKIQKKKFDSKKWKKDIDNRYQMIQDFRKNIFTENMTFKDLKKWLEEPDSVLELKQAPWELKICCLGSAFNWDVFFYWPTENYPQYIYGGNVEKIGTWAYVHE